MVGQPAKVGRGLRTIALNIAALSKETDTWVAANGKVKVSLKDQEGNMRNTYDIMKDLHEGVEGQSTAWDKLSNSEKTAIAQQVAGKNQFEVFTAVMGNFGNAVDATNTALNSTGSAEKENAKAMESIAGHLQKLKSAFEYFAYKTISSDFIKSIIDAGTTLMEFLGSDLGQATLKFAAIGTGVGVAIKAFLKLKKAIEGLTILEGLKSLIVGTDSLKGAAKGAEATTEAMEDLGGTIPKVVSAVGGLGTALGILGGLAAIGGIIYAVVKATKKSDELTAAYGKTKEKIAENSSEIENLRNNADKLTQAEKERLDILIRQNQELKKQAKEEAAAALEEETGKGAGFGAKEGTVAKSQIEQYKALGNTIEQYTAKQKKLDQEYLSGKIDLDDYTEASKKNADVIKEASESSEKLAGKYSDAAKEGVKLSDDQKKLKGVVDDNIKSLKEYTKLEDFDAEQIKAIFPNADELAKTDKGMALLEDRANSLIQALAGGDKGGKAFTHMMEGIEGGYKNLGKYNKETKKFELDNTNVEDYAKALEISTEYAQELLKVQTKNDKISWKIPQKELNNFNKSAQETSNTLKDSEGNMIKSRDDLVKLGQSLGIADAAIPSFIKGWKDAGNNVIDFSAKTPEVIKSLSKVGDSFGITVDKAGKLDKVNLNQLAQGVHDLGGSEADLSKLVSTISEMEGVELTGDYSDYIDGTKSAEEAAKSLYEWAEKTDETEVHIGAESDVEEVVFDAESSMDEMTAKEWLAEILGVDKTDPAINKAWGSLSSLTDAEWQALITGEDNTGSTTASARQKLLSVVTPQWIAKLFGQDVNATSKANAVKQSVNSVPKNHTTTFSGNTSLLSRAVEKAKNLVASAKSALGFATGKHKGEQGGIAYVGEEGEEIVETPTGAYLVGQHGTEVANIGREDVVYTAAQTKHLLRTKYKGLEEYEYLPRYAKGKKGKGKGKKHAKSDSKSAKRYASQLEALEHSYDIGKISEATFIKRLKKLTKYTKVSTDQWRNYEKTYYDYVNKKQTESLDKKIESLDAEKGFTKKTLNSVQAAVKTAYDKRKITLDQYKEYNEKIQEAIADKEKERFNKLAEREEAKRKMLEIYADQQKEAIQSQIDALEKQKDAQDEANEAVERANALAEKEQALTEAKNKKLKVYKEGVGFVYESDIQEIAKAQKELDDLKAEYAKEDIEKEIDKKIEVLEKQQQAWDDYIDAENRAEEIKQLEKEAGISFKNLTSGLKQQITSAFKGKYNTAGELMHAYESIADAVASGAIKIDKKTGLVDAKTLQAYINKNKYADGTLSAAGGLSKVGERGAELRVLNPGDGIIPADLTRNLMEIGRYSMKDLMQLVETKKSSQSVTQFNFGQGSIVVHGNNAETLAYDIMENMERLAHQKSSVRR